MQQKVLEWESETRTKDYFRKIWYSLTIYRCKKKKKKKWRVKNKAKKQANKEG